MFATVSASCTVVVSTSPGTVISFDAVFTGLVSAWASSTVEYATIYTVCVPCARYIPAFPLAAKSDAIVNTLSNL